MGFKNRIYTRRIIGFTIVISLILFFPWTSSDVCAQEEEPRTLNLGFSELIDTASPFNGVNDVSYVFYSMIYDCLISADENFNPVPNLARSWWYMDGNTSASLAQPTDFSMFEHNKNSSDWPLGSIWEYNLTENVFWNDGEPFTSVDVVWTIGIQILDVFGVVWTNMEYTQWIYHIEAVGDYKVRIFFADWENKQPIPISWGNKLFIPILAQHFFADKPPSYYIYKYDGVPAIGTGPFMGTDDLRIEMINKEQVTLIKNPYYDFVDSNDSIRKGLGAVYNRTTEIDKLVLKFYSDEPVLAQSVKTGDVDAAKLQGEIYLQWAEDPDLQSSIDLQKILHPDSYSKIISINAKENALDRGNILRLDPAVQRAIVLATDKKSIIDQVYHGLGVEGMGLISPIWTDWWWEPEDELSYFSVYDDNGDELFNYSKPLGNVMDYDPILANKILDEAGYEWTGEKGNSTRKATLAVGERLQYLGLLDYPDIVVDLELEFEMEIDISREDERQIADILANLCADVGIAIYPQIVSYDHWAGMIYSYTFTTAMTSLRDNLDPNGLCYIPTSFALYGWNEFGVDDEDYDNMYIKQTKSLNYSERKYWVDECTKWQYLSGCIITIAYPEACYAMNTEPWYNWGDLSEHPGRVMDGNWGENPLWFDLQFSEEEEDKASEMDLILMGIIFAALIAAIIIIYYRLRPKKGSPEISSLPPRRG